MRSISTTTQSPMSSLGLLRRTSKVPLTKNGSNWRPRSSPRRWPHWSLSEPNSRSAATSSGTLPSRPRASRPRTRPLVAPRRALLRARRSERTLRRTFRRRRPRSRPPGTVRPLGRRHVRRRAYSRTTTAQFKSPVTQKCVPE